jgi:hypothetical protein
LDIIGYRLELVKDPYGILAGERYEFYVDIEVAEDDELFSELGLYVRIVYRVEEEASAIVNYEIRERQSERYLDFELDEEELAALQTFCQEHLPK